ncbi:MAG: tRNA threonylcarbamoyladenosine dehydratase [Lachnospiraceae bacterium]|nr:tRNA threonylcarbamoyladenosine dehydratase [Lachnospiraceae bacterium]
MTNNFQRFAMLIGKDKIEELNKKKVIIFGLGGVGGSLAEALTRAGIGHFTLVDKDSFDETNLNRQLFATYKTVGMNKTDVAKEKMLSINPNAEIETRKMFFLPENSDEFDFSQYDYVVDAIDNVTAKIALILKAKKEGANVISSMGMGNKFDPTQIKIDDIYKTSVCKLAKVMRKELKKRGVTDLKVAYSTEIPVKPLFIAEGNDERTPGSSPFVPPCAGIIMAGEIIKDLL